MNLGAVSMLTAHASKGLEFDTVFVPRVSGPHGYPKTSGSDDQVIPEGLVDVAEDLRDTKSRKIDEERRVFYVAITRAHKRVVLLAKVPKKPSSVNFVFELRNALNDSMIERDAFDVLDPSEAGDAVSRLGAEFAAVNRMRDVFDQAKREVRRDAAIAMDAMELGELSREELFEKLEVVAKRATIIRTVLESGELPQWVNGSSLEGFGSSLVDALEDKCSENDEQLHPGLTGPLKLSFTQISGYLHCPRCYLVEQVLRLPMDEGAPAVVGKAVHQALESFYQKWRIADADGADKPGFEILESMTKQYFFEHWPRDMVVDADKLKQAQAMIQLYWDSMHDEDVHIEELEKKMVLPYEFNGVVHTIRAVLDRVDATDSGGRRVIDYKTGRPRKELSEPKKDDLQLGIYAMALEHAFGDPGPGSVCEYWLLQDGTKGSIGMDAIKMDKVRLKIEKAISGMLEGKWDQSNRCKTGQRSSVCAILDDLGPSGFSSDNSRVIIGISTVGTGSTSERVVFYEYL
jgi:RecB family exonuclease